MRKNFFTSLTLILLLASIPACSLTSGHFLPAENINKSILASQWKVNDRIYILDQEGHIFLPTHQDTSGGMWQIDGNEIFFSFIDSPAHPMREERWKFVSLSKNRIILENSYKERVTWRNDTTELETLKGEFYFLERLGLPPQIILNITLTQDNGQTNIASSSTIENGSIPISYTLFYDKNSIDPTKDLELQAAIFYNENAIFSTESRVSIPNTSKEIEAIRLIHSTPDISAPENIISPIEYTFQGKTQNFMYSARLYLKDEHFFFLTQKKRIESKTEQYSTWGKWNQVGRGHSLELLTSNGENFTAAIRPDQTITFETLPHFNTNIPLTFTVAQSSSLNRELFSLDGHIERKNNLYYFTPCGLTKAYLLKGDTSKLENKQNSDASISIQYNEDQSFTLKSIDLHKNSICNPSENSVNIDRSLENSYWRLNTLNNVKAFMTEESNTELHFILRHAEGKTNSGDGSGSDGCNTFFINWEAHTEEQKITIMLGGSTMRLCHDEELNKQAQTFLQSLDKANNFEIQGSILKLKQDELLLATFEAVDL